MNKFFLLLAVGGFTILSQADAVSAGPVPDVPPGHWAKPAVQSLVAKKVMSTRADGTFHGSKPVTRYELAVALDRMIRYIEAGRKPLHAVPPQAALRVRPGSLPAVKAAMLHLSHDGFLPRSSFAFKGNGAEAVTARQLSDALAQVTIRLSDRSLPPNAE